MDTKVRLSLALLGSFEVTLDGHPISFESVKVRALLAYLAVEAGRSHARTFLAEILWPDLPAATALTYLRHVLGKLKQAIPDAMPGGPPVLLVTRETVALNPCGDYTLDIAAFTALLEACATHPHRHLETCASCARRRADAVALYRGDFLAHFLLGDSVAFEEWAALKRERLRQQVLDALARLVTYYERCGAYQDAQRFAWRQVELDPWRDEAYQPLMRALWLSGQRGAALEQYARFERILQQELGVAPSAETTALYERIRDAGTSTLPDRSPSHPPHNLPAQTTPLVGREAELARLGDLLQQPAHRLITLTGPGGIGKTRLALQAADVLDDFDDGVCFVALAPVADPALVIPAIAQALGVQESTGQPLLESVKVHLRGRELLLVLDNFEHVGAAASCVAALLGAAPRLVVLVTSRVVLRLYGEHEFPVPPLTVPDVRQLPAPVDLSQYEAVRLFVARAQAVQPDFAITGETAPAVAVICHRLDGLPLAIELAAARIRLLSPQAMLPRLGNPLALLTGGARDLPERHHTLRATIDWSYNLLPAGEQWLFARLAVFAGGWTLEAAETVIGAQESPARHDPAILDGMEALVTKNLVRRQAPGRRGTDGALRFEMLETIREYALERLEASGTADTVRGRHLLCFRDLAEAAEPHLKRAEQGRWLAGLDDERSNIRAALEWALDHGAYDDGLRLAAALHWFWHFRGHDREGYQWMQRLLGISPKIAPAIRARALPTAAFFAWILGERAEARAWAEEGVSLSRETGDLHSLAHSLVMLGWAASEERRQVLFMDDALDVARSMGDTWWIAMALWFKSDIYRGRDDEQAQALLEESLPLLRRIGNAWSLGWNLAELGQVVYRHGQYDRAAALFEESLAQLSAIGQSSGIATALHGFGMAAHDQGDDARAETLLDEALARFREVGHQSQIADLLCARGKVALAQGDIERATILFEESRALYEDIDMSAGSARSLHLLGRVALVCGDVGRARTLLTESLRRRQGGAIHDIAESLEALAGLAVAEAHPHADRLATAGHAVRMLSVAAAARAEVGIPLPPGDRAAYERDIAVLRDLLDEEAFDAAWAVGLGMTPEQAIAYALEETNSEQSVQRHHREPRLLS
jgi:predicted ATPase/DNA-binding SARP family transcriptional activator